MEGAVIVGSILLAFGIDAWWTERSDRIRLAAAVENVVAEVSAGRSEIDVDYRMATDLTLSLLERSAPHGILLAVLSEESDQAIPGAVSLSQALASLRRDVAAVGVVAQLVDEDEDYTRQLAEGITLAVSEGVAPGRSPIPRGTPVRRSG